LLILLAVAVGALGYDFSSARPQCEAADKKVQEFVDTQNRKGVKEAALVSSADIQKVIGFGPTWVEEHDDKGYTKEYYCWWGKVPLLTRRRHFIAVVYVGNKPRHYSSHYREEPPTEAYPIADANPPALQKMEAITSPTNSPGDESKGEKGSDKTDEGAPKEGEKSAEKPAEKSGEEKAAPKEADKPAGGDKEKP
jgi:hypothetical protein